MDLSQGQIEELLDTLKKRFEENMPRHHGLDWAKIEAKIEAQPQKLASLYQMEQTGGEPDVVAYDEKSDHYIFYDCAPESPSERRNSCYDGQAQNARKANKPPHNAMDMALEMGVEMLDEEQYRYLQTLGKFDLKTSTWIKTPDAIRKLGGALFCDRRYDHIFVYHNGAQSYYASRGFRGLLKV